MPEVRIQEKYGFTAQVLSMWLVIGAALLFHWVAPPNGLTGEMPPMFGVLFSGYISFLSIPRALRRRSIWPIASAVPLTLLGLSLIVRDFGWPPRHLLIPAVAGSGSGPLWRAVDRYLARRAEGKARIQSERAAEWDRAISAATPG